jgi:type IV conjugative transfer system lipoprotein TraV
MSVTGIYINAQKGTLPAMQRSLADESELKTKSTTDLPSAFGSLSDHQVHGVLEPARSSANADGKRLAAYSDTRAGTGLMSPADMETPQSGQPIRSAPKVMRIWMAPFQDTDNDLHDQRYLFVTVHTGKWLIEANQVNIQRQFRPVFQLGQRSRGSDDTDDGEAKGSVRRDLAPGITDVPQRSGPGYTGQVRQPGMN